MGENSAIFSKLEHDIQELNSLLELTFISNQVSNIEAFLDEIENFISRKLNIKDVTFLYADVNRILRARKESVFELQIDLEADDFCRELKPFLNNENITEVSEDSLKKYKFFLEKYELQELFDYNLKAFFKDGNISALCIFSDKNDLSDYNPKEAYFLNRVFSFIEPILYKFITKKEQDSELQSLHKTLHNLSILYSISQAVNFVDDLKRLLRVVLNKALDTIHAEKASLMFYDYGENSLHVKFIYGLEDKNLESDINNGLIECTKIKAGEGIAGTVFIEKRSIISNLGQSDPRYHKPFEVSHTNSLLCVPLIAKGEAIGVINITNKKEGKLFTKKDLEFMEALANQAAIAVDNAKLYELATKDGLTKLYIYRHFYTLLENEIKRAARYEHPMSILMMDIDNFKIINDTYGHPVGDQVLREIANVINNTVRKIDIPARYGGEEFSVILPETEGKDARVIANRLRENISKLSIKARENVYVKPTISIGISSFPTCSDNEQTLIELADIALYQAKAAGKNIVYEYTPMGCFPIDITLGL